MGGPAPPARNSTLCRRAFHPNLLPTHNAPQGALFVSDLPDSLPYKHHRPPTRTQVNGFQSLPRSSMALPTGPICFRFAFICFPSKCFPSKSPTLLTNQVFARGARHSVIDPNKQNIKNRSKIRHYSKSNITSNDNHMPD